jgi:polyhydroxybutyrate depolymerase
MHRRKVVPLVFVGLAASESFACSTTTPDNPGGTGGSGNATTSGGGAGQGTNGGSGGTLGAAAGGGSGGSSSGKGGSSTGVGGAAGGGGAGATGGTAGGSSGAGASPGGSGGSGGAGAGGKAGSGSGGATAGAPAGGAGSGGSAGAPDTSGPCPTGGKLKAGDQTLMISSDGMDRSFLVHVPTKYDGTTRMPVVFDFHGLGGNSNQQKQLSGWASLGDTEGFITVFPQGLGDSPGWNADGCCTKVADDVAFVRAIIMQLTSQECIDTKRIYSTGCSNGGAMSFMLACHAADVIAAVAPVDFDCVVGGRCANCDPGRPITEVQFRATKDQAVDYSGAEPNFEAWGDINMCSGDAAPLATNAACQTYPMCGAGAETILCTVQDGTHCANYKSFMIPQVAWPILKAHPLP